MTRISGRWYGHRMLGRVSSPMDVVVIGGGIIGCTAAAELAAAGADVTLIEETAIGAGASGRNLGALQHPFDDDLVGLHMETLAIYRDLAAESHGFGVPSDPARGPGPDPRAGAGPRRCAARDRLSDSAGRGDRRDGRARRAARSRDPRR